MGKCETSKGIFLIHQCGNDTEIMCKRCGKYVCNEHYSNANNAPYCASCLYDEACCQTNGKNGADSIIRQFFGEIDNTGKLDAGTTAKNTLDIDDLTNAQSRERHLAALRKTAGCSIAATASGAAAAIVTPLAVHELFAFENPASDLTDPAAGSSKGAGFTDS
jgi:hypothetical protein